jgi:NAD-dependent deacetylase
VEGLDDARTLVERARTVSVLTGAGISTASGIPDFRGPEGLWTKDPAAELLSTYEVWVADQEVRRAAWRRRVDARDQRPLPNDGHRALVELERTGRLDTLVTQNIDGLHQLAGNDPARVIEIHGTMREVQCMACGARAPMENTLDRVRAGEEDPACLEVVPEGGRRCGGVLKSATISFGQNLVAADLARAEQAASRGDVLLAVGSTLSVYPAAGLVPTAHMAGARIVIVNGEPTEYDAIADVVVRAPIGEVLPTLVGASGA